MENKKNLKINSAVCDVRNITEELLDTYGEVEINTACVIISPEVQALLGKYKAKLNCAATATLGGNVDVSTINGPMTIAPGQVMPVEKVYLIINGPLEILPGSENVLKNYAGMTINGPVTCPESMSGLLSSFNINGPVRTYPDGSIVLKNTTILNRVFYLRAKQDALYYAASRIVALASDIDFTKLAQKNIRFVTKRLLVSESLTEAAVPLFDEKADIVVLPDGCTYVDDDAELNEPLLKRYGDKLYINGDLNITPDSAPLLDQVSFLRVNGDLLVSRNLKDQILAMDLEYNDLYMVGSVLITDRAKTEISAAMLEAAKDGLSVMNCAHVSISADVSPKLLEEKLVSIISCASVSCANKEQLDVVEPLARDVASLSLNNRETEDDEPSDDDNVIKINAASYTF
ncbi:MAG: hypothetical protein HDR04_10655 [Lachnospiraceae bacterium]|nr:hypothetical protein [Lachnospiraceae bacterium]